ncbi:MerR family transcriptional regulator [Streptosporangium sp. NPDC000396]|uniref:MerR family transcriptional regulator n=1 Tax=Streptosporangium sp. NPDC000396 TaxID=3366185 RepID=UPI0036BF9CEA
MLRIGELATLAGVTTRTIRHYHQVGLLTEPPRTTTGHRLYGMADVVRLIRIRRLTALGMSLPDIGRVLSPRQDLHKALADLDADLAREEEAVRRQRAMLAELRHTGRDPALTPELSQIVAELEQVFPGHPLLERERETIALLETVAPETARALTDVYRLSMGDEKLQHRMWDLGLRFEALRHVSPGDPEVAELAAEFADALRPFLGYTPSGDRAGAVPGTAVLDDLSPAQRRAVELITR